MVLKSGIKRLSSLEKRYEVGTYIHFIRLVGRVARLVSILAVYDRSRVFFNALSHEKATFFVFGARCGACSARTLGEFALNAHVLCMRR